RPRTEDRSPAVDPTDTFSSETRTHIDDTTITKQLPEGKDHVSAADFTVWLQWAWIERTRFISTNAAA
ncbi:MAG: hypothetical protein OXC68_10410, partial [Aestuariivita sp.]|nr:hypothetical protein [Aestuariivita sp.]